MALLTVLAAAPCAQARDALGAIDACVMQLDGLDIGYQRIAARCPDLTPSLVVSPWEAWLPRDCYRPNNQLSAVGLVTLRALLPAEAARLPPAHELRTNTVSAVLAGLPAADQPRSWWQRLKIWLRELFTRASQPSHDSWLQRLIIRMHLPTTLTRWIEWLGFAFAAVLGVGIVLNELRLAGWLTLRRGRARRAAGAGSGVGAAVRLEHASPSQQPRLLLELVAARLVQQSRLPPARALTLRELRRAARLADAADHSRLDELASVCERVRFSDQEVAPALLARALAQGRELLASLDAPFAQPQGS